MESNPHTYQAPLQIGDVPKRETRTQFAALCYRRRKSDCEVLLLTSLDTKRWIIPKGWPMDGMTPADAAAREAWEEGGVRGHVFDACIGIYSYTKVMQGEPDLPVVVAVFPLEVSRLVDEYPEAGLRKRKWFPPKKAAARVQELELKQLLREFDPSRLR
ncbi:NUDIX domain-containing protein [Rhodobacterales bacterium HKCCE3408]|nr:NUDIX domain-containing protein [Rhodobacterales bacterium HKCCE3408]